MALSVVLLGLIGNAIYFHLRTFQTRQDGVEQSLLARAILRHMADDLRCAVAYRSVDTKGLDAISLDPTKLAAGALGAGVDPATIASATQSLNANSNANSAAKPQGANPTANTASSPETETTEAGPSFQAGFYGDPFSLQFEITRLPRLDEYDPLFAGDGTGSVLRIPADMRTISYHLDGEAPAARSEQVAAGVAVKPDALTQLATNITNEPRGLVRSEQERSLAAAGVESESSDEASSGDQMLADEVTQLEFRYFDGYEWWPEWDSDLRGGLPYAVEILLTLANGSSSASANGSSPALTSTTTPTALPNETVYRMVVKIPTAQPLRMPEETSEAEAATSSSPATPASNTGGTP
jgi:hypothetical protein